MVALHPSRIDLKAAALELVPLLAPFVLVVAIFTNWAPMFSIAVAVALVSGLGWRRLGHPMLGLAFCVCRAFVLLGLLYWGMITDLNEIVAQQGPGAGDASRGAGDYILGAATIFFAGTALASATCVALVSRERASVA